MNREWRTDLDSVTLGWLVYLTVAPEDIPDQLPPEDVVGFRTETGWFVLNANCKRIACNSVRAWAEIPRKPPRD